MTVRLAHTHSRSAAEMIAPLIKAKGQVVTVMACDAGVAVALGDAGDPVRVGGVRTHLRTGERYHERIVSAHGGRIEVASNEERGTTFTVHLPRG